MLKAGLLGLGIIGKTHFNDAYGHISSDKIQLEAVFDLSDENLAVAEGLRTYTDLEEFFANEQGKLDFVDICLPTFMHKDVSVKAMEYGFNVLCEKPMALSAEDALEMYQVSLRTGRKLMIAHCLKFDDDYQIMKEYTDSGRLGNVRQVNYTNYRENLPGGHNNWFRDSRLSGGAIIDVHIHDTDTILWLFGQPESVSTAAPVKNHSGCYDAFTTNLMYSDGKVVNIQCDYTLSNVNHNYSRTIRIIYDKGYILKTDDLFVAVDENGKETDLTLKRSTEYSDFYYNEILYFADCLESGKDFSECHPIDSINALKLILTEIESADKKGEKIYWK